MAIPTYQLVVVPFFGLFIPIHLFLAIYVFVKLVLQLKKCNRNFVIYVYIITLLYALAKIVFLCLHIYSKVATSVVPAVRALIVAFDNSAMQLVFMLFDTVVISWANIYSNVRAKERHLSKVISTIVIIKYIVVFVVLLGYTIAASGSWDPNVTSGFSWAFSAAMILSALVFLAIFMVMSLKTTSLTRNSTSLEAIRVCHKKLTTTSVIVIVSMSIVVVLLLVIHISFTLIGRIPGVDVTVNFGFVDVSSMLQMVVSLPAMFWLMFVTYSNNSIIVKFLTNQARQETKETQKKIEETLAAAKNSEEADGEEAKELKETKEAKEENEVKEEKEVKEE